LGSEWLDLKKFVCELWPLSACLALNYTSFGLKPLNPVGNPDDMMLSEILVFPPMERWQAAPQDDIMSNNSFGWQQPYSF